VRLESVSSSHIGCWSGEGLKVSLRNVDVWPRGRAGGFSDWRTSFGGAKTKPNCAYALGTCSLTQTRQARVTPPT